MSCPHNMTPYREAKIEPYIPTNNCKFNLNLSQISTYRETAPGVGGGGGDSNIKKGRDARREF